MKKKKKNNKKKKESSSTKEIEEEDDIGADQFSNFLEKLDYYCPKPKWCLDKKNMRECKPLTKRFKLDLVSLDAFSEFLEQ
jgi:hypothetical protein